MKNPFAWDPDDIETTDLPRFLQPIHRAYLWASPQVTGHSAHGLNGILVWLLIGGPLWLPLWLWWIPVSVFYLGREFPYRTSDNFGDVSWVLAIGLMLWLPFPGIGVAFGWSAACLAMDIYTWVCTDPPAWMPRDKLLWLSTLGG